MAPGERAAIPTGIAIALPPGSEGQIRPRSGLAMRHGVTVLNSPGTVDADYRGEIQVMLINFGADTFTVDAGCTHCTIESRSWGKQQFVRARTSMKQHVELRVLVLRVRGCGSKRAGWTMSGSRIVPIGTILARLRPAIYSVPLLPRKGMLAIAAVIDIAINARGRPVAAKMLGDRHRLPPRHLEPVLQALVRHGILKGVRGPRGGYEFARDQRHITADDILRAAGAADETEAPAINRLASCSTKW